MRACSILLLTALGGCANLGIEPAALSTPVETGSIAAPVEPRETARGELSRTQQKAIEEARRPLRAFLADKNRNCSSATLKEAASKTTETATALATGMRPDYFAMIAAGAAVLEVADGARSKGCGDQARALYNFVLRNYAGLGYAELRDKATTGMKALEGRG